MAAVAKDGRLDGGGDFLPGGFCPGKKGRWRWLGEEKLARVLGGAAGVLLKALFTPRVFPSPRGLGIRGDLVKTPLSPNPHFPLISPHFPTPFPTASSYFDFGDGRGWKRIEI
jgi:hypothetical protein